MNNTIIEALESRYATQKFDREKKLDDNQVETLVETARLTATSYGLQLMKLVLVENADLKEKLVSASYGQRQVSDASHVLVLCRERKVDLAQIESYIQNISETRSIELGKLDRFKNSMVRNLLNKSEEELEKWMTNQVYISLGKLLAVCALMKIDSCPMEGFKADEYDEILDLEKLNLTSVLVLPVGYRSSEDTNAQAKKVRRSSDNFLVKL